MKCKEGMPVCEVCKVPVCRLRHSVGFWCASCETVIGRSFGAYGAITKRREGLS